MNRRTTDRRNDQGVALILALGMMFIIVALGTAYVGYMEVEADSARNQLREAHIRHAAEAGIYAAIGEMAGSLAEGGLATAPRDPLTFELPVYSMQRVQAGEGEGALQNLALRASENTIGRVTVTVTDEAGRVNINHAPTRVLQALLGVDGETARAVRRRLPRGEDREAPQPPTADRHWFSSVRDVQALLPADTYNQLNLDLLTVYSVDDNAAPTGYLNLNTPHPAVLGAILGVDPAEAEAVIAKGPFASVAELAAAAGKEPVSWNVPPGDGGLAPELSFASRVFRFACEAQLVDTAGEAGGIVLATRRVEAVVRLRADGTPDIRYWAE